MNLKCIILLLRVKLKILINGFIKGSAKKRGRKLLALIGGAFLFFFIFQWIFGIFATLGNLPSVGNAMLANAIVMVFLGFFVFLLASGITVSIHYLFISSDLPLLMVSPISNNTIFTFKLIEAVFANSTFFFFMGIPIFIAYGIVSQAQWYYYPMMILNALIFLTIPISISFLGALLIVRIIPPARAREFMALLLGLISLGIWLVLQIIRASTFDPNSQDFNPRAMESLQQVSHHTLFQLLPSTWAARSLVGFAHGDFRLLVYNFVPLLILMYFLFVIGIRLSKNAFRQGFISSQQSITLKRKKTRKARTQTTPLGLSAFTSGVTGSVFLRDLKLLFRDTRQLVNILMFAAMMIILPLLQQPEQFNSELANYYPYFFVLIFSAIIAGQLSSRLIPIEGKSFWITLLLPQSSLRLLGGKFVVGFSLSTALSWLAVAIISVYFHHPVRIIMLALVATVCFSAMLSATGLLLASFFSRFDWDHPKRMLSGAGGILLSLSALVLVGLMVGVAILIHVIGTQFRLSTQFLDVFTSIVVMALSAIVTAIIMVLSAKKLDKIEWKF